MMMLNWTFPLDQNPIVKFIISTFHSHVLQSNNSIWITQTCETQLNISSSGRGICSFVAVKIFQKKLEATIKLAFKQNLKSHATNYYMVRTRQPQCLSNTMDQRKSKFSWKNWHQALSFWINLQTKIYGEEIEHHHHNEVQTGIGLDWDF